MRAKGDAFVAKLVAEGHDTVRCLQVDDYKLAVGHWDGVIQVYDLRTYEAFEVLKYRNILYTMQMDDYRLVTGSHGTIPALRRRYQSPTFVGFADATVQIWDFKDQECYDAT
jgi:hypothetical protein